jgi:HEAT repeat protein
MLGWLSRVFGGSRPAVVEPPLAVEAGSDDPARREAAAGPLAAVPELWAGELLLKMLQDSTAGVRAAAKEALRKRGVLAAPELLTGLNHADPQLAATAAELLGEMRVADVAQPLVVALKFSDRPVQIAARRALARLGSLAVPALQAAKEDPQYWVRQQVAEILAEIHGPTQSDPTPSPAA